MGRCAAHNNPVHHLPAGTNHPLSSADQLLVKNSYTHGLLTKKEKLMPRKDSHVNQSFTSLVETWNALSRPNNKTNQRS